MFSSNVSPFGQTVNTSVFGQPVNNAFSSSFSHQSNEYKMNRTLTILFDGKNEKEIQSIICDNLVFCNFYEQFILCKLPLDFMTNEFYNELKEKINLNLHTISLDYYHENKSITLYLNNNRLRKSFRSFCYNNVNIITTNRTYSLKFLNSLLNIDLINLHEKLLYLYEKCFVYSISVESEIKKPSVELVTHKIIKQKEEQKEEKKVKSKQTRKRNRE